MQVPLEVVEDLGAHAQRIAEARAPTGTTMNSWKSTVLSACAPPLRMFIIGTGRTRADRRRGSDRAAIRLGCGGARDGERDAEDRVRPEAALVRRAVELDQRTVDRRLLARVAADDLRGDAPLTFATAS